MPAGFRALLALTACALSRSAQADGGEGEALLLTYFVKQYHQDLTVRLLAHARSIAKLEEQRAAAEAKGDAAAAALAESGKKKAAVLLKQSMLWRVLAVGLMVCCLGGGCEGNANVQRSC